MKTKPTKSPKTATRLAIPGCYVTMGAEKIGYFKWSHFLQAFEKSPQLIYTNMVISYFTQTQWFMT